MVSFFEIVQSFIQFLLDGFEISSSFAIQFVEIITGCITLIVNILEPFPFLITTMVIAVLSISIIKLTLSIVGVII